MSINQILERKMTEQKSQILKLSRDHQTLQFSIHGHCMVSPKI